MLRTLTVLACRITVAVCAQIIDALDPCDEPYCGDFRAWDTEYHDWQRLHDHFNPPEDF